MMKNQLVVTAVRCLLTGMGLILGLAVVMAASREGSPVLAAVDVARVKDQSIWVQGQLVDLAGPVVTIQSDLKAKRQLLMEKLELYRAQAAAVSEEVNHKRQDEIDRLNEEVKVLGRRFTEAWDEAERAGLGPVRDQIMTTVQSLCRRRGVQLVVSMEAVLYLEPDVDLTDEVIRRLDAASGK